jgi:hypothetical protein
MALRQVLSDAEVEEFRALVRQHTAAELTADEARAAVDQLLDVLSVIRTIALRGSTDSTSPVDGHPLPEAGIHAITTALPT